MHPSGVYLFPNGTLCIDVYRLNERWEYPLHGELLPLPAMMHAPVNEAGVLVLFGALAEQLGFVVEAVGLPFPDAVVKHAMDAERRRWRRLRVEFEYRSSNFRVHRHDSDGCDLIVCWEHDWPKCPVTVVELRRIVRELAARGQLPAPR